MRVLIHPNPTLAQCAEAVDPARDDTLRDLARTMANEMYGSHGIGLAAPQVGVLKRVIVYDLDDENRALTALCNPRIVSYSEEREVDDEGCLSLPGISVPIERACSVVCEGLSLEGVPVSVEADGLHARLLQHEIDHLDGVIILDRATPEERKAALRRYREAIEAGARPGETSI